MKKECYAAEIEALKGRPLHFNITDNTCTCPEYPEFEYKGKMNVDDVYYALCEWLRERKEAGQPYS